MWIIGAETAVKGREDVLNFNTGYQNVRYCCWICYCFVRIIGERERGRYIGHDKGWKGHLGNSYNGVVNFGWVWWTMVNFFRKLAGIILNKMLASYSQWRQKKLCLDILRLLLHLCEIRITSSCLKFLLHCPINFTRSVESVITFLSFHKWSWVNLNIISAEFLA